MSLPYRTRASVQPHPVGCTVLRPLGHFQRQSPRENPSPETGALSAPFHPLPSIDALNVKVSGLKREFDATSDPEKKSSVARELGQFEEKLEQREKKWKKHGV